MVDPDTCFNYWKFVYRYCFVEKTEYGIKIGDGTKNADELQQILSAYMVRHTKDEVLTDLPEKTYYDEIITPNLTFEAFYEDYKSSLLSEIESAQKEQNQVKLIQSKLRGQVSWHGGQIKRRACGPHPIVLLGLGLGRSLTNLPNQPRLLD